MTTHWTLATLLLAALAHPAHARGFHGDTRSYSHYASKRCVSDACYGRHPGGRYAFPFHNGRRR